MLNYIVADLKRIAHKKSLWIVLVCFIGFYFVGTQLARVNGGGIPATSTMIGYSGAFPIFLGIPIFLSVYADDMKAKAMQVAIGLGLSREKVILVKIIETVILTTVLALISAILMLGTGLVQGISFSELPVSTIVPLYLWYGLVVLSYIVLLSPALYLTQNYVVGNTLYILLAAEIPANLLSLLLSLKFVKDVIGDGSKYLLTNVLKTQIRALLNQTSIPAFTWVALLIYLVVPTLLAMMVFKKKELEF